MCDGVREKWVSLKILPTRESELDPWAGAARQAFTIILMCGVPPAFSSLGKALHQKMELGRRDSYRPLPYRFVVARDEPGHKLEVYALLPSN